MRRSWNTTSRRIGSRLVVAVLTLCGLAAPAAAGDQVAFTATARAVVTDVTHLPGGLTQSIFSISGTAAHLGDFTGPGTNIGDNKGNFTAVTVFVGANETNSVFLTVSGRFERTDDDCVRVVTGGTFIVTGGTGAFANATGGGTITGFSDVCADGGPAIYTGTISRPNSG